MKLSDLIRRIRENKEHKCAIQDALPHLSEGLALAVQPLAQISNQYYRAVALAIESIELTEMMKSDTLSRLAENTNGFGTMFEAEDGNTYTLSSPGPEHETFTVKLLGKNEWRVFGGSAKIRRIF